MTGARDAVYDSCRYLAHGTKKKVSGSDKCDDSY